MVTTLCFSRDNAVLTSGSNDCAVHLWNFAKFMSELNLEDQVSPTK